MRGGCNSDSRGMPSSPPEALLQSDSYMYSSCWTAHSLRGLILGPVFVKQLTFSVRADMWSSATTTTTRPGECG